jgi:hypothetical protein
VTFFFSFDIPMSHSINWWFYFKIFQLPKHVVNMPTIAPTIENNIWLFLTMLSTKQDIHDFWISLVDRKYPPTYSIN